MHKKVTAYIFECPYLRGLFRIRAVILPVQVKSTEVAAVIPYYHPIRVKHRNYLENVLISEALGHFLVRSYVLY